MKCFVSPIDEAQDARDFFPGAKRERAEDFSPQKPRQIPSFQVARGGNARSLAPRPCLQHEANLRQGSVWHPRLVAPRDAGSAYSLCISHHVEGGNAREFFPGTFREHEE